MSLKMDHVGPKTRSLGQMLEKLCVRSRRHICNLMVRMFLLMKSQKSLKMGHVGSETRSLDQMLEKPYVCTKATFSVG